jgi:hypothetical protein
VGTADNFSKVPENLPVLGKAKINELRMRMRAIPNDGWALVGLKHGELEPLIEIADWVWSVCDD